MKRQKKLSKDNAIVFGNVDVSDEDMKNPKFRITAFLDLDLVAELKRRARNGEGHGKYQALLNEVLRQALFQPEDATDMHDRAVGYMLKAIGAMRKAGGE